MFNNRVFFKCNINFRFMHRNDQNTWLLKISDRYLRSENISVFCIPYQIFNVFYHFSFLYISKILIIIIIFELNTYDVN